MARMTPVPRTEDTTDPAPELRQRWADTVTAARGTKNPAPPTPPRTRTTSCPAGASPNAATTPSTT